MHTEEVSDTKHIKNVDIQYSISGDIIDVRTT